MRDPFITAVNAEKSALSWFNALAENATNIYTPGFREKRMLFSNFIGGTASSDLAFDMSQAKAIPGRLPSNLFIEGKGMFVVRKDDGTMMYTRLGDFRFDANGSLVNDYGHKLQGYLVDEKGTVIQSGATTTGKSANSHTNGGPAHMPTTEINLWIDPSNGKFFGKYDEYKVTADGMVMGVSEGGKKKVPLYRVALASFVNPEGLAEVQDNMFVPTAQSGQPVEGSGEISQGMLETSNTSMRETVNYLQQAKLQLDVTQKLINTNKQLIQESLRLIQ